MYKKHQIVNTIMSKKCQDFSHDFIKKTKLSLLSCAKKLNIFPSILEKKPNSPYSHAEKNEKKVMYESCIVGAI